VRLSSAPPGDVEALVGPLARRLAARALVCWPGPPPADGLVTLELSSAALDVEARNALAGLDGARLEPRADGRERLIVPATSLAELATRGPVGRCIAATHAAAAAPPAPGRLLGIVNTTPDSFSDGGEFLAPERAVEHGLRLAAEGAEILDVGGESTRPGAAVVPLARELERVLPVVRALARETRAAISIDTTKSEVARAALAEGATLVNDVSAGRADPHMLALVAERGAGLILMHARGTPRDMQRAPRYADVVREVSEELRAAAAAAWSAGVDPARIALDPGFGFGKLPEHNQDLMRALPELRSLGFPVCVGLSRKSFLGHLTGEPDPLRRGPATTAAVALCAALGAELQRVHEVAPARAALRVAAALRPAPSR
jgi:dihydropteroate synthase